MLLERSLTFQPRLLLCITGLSAARVRSKDPLSRGDQVIACRDAPLKAGDLLPLAPAAAKPQAGNRVPPAWVPAYPAEGAPWEIGVLPGPNAAPDYFTEEDIQTLYSATYTVHYNS